MADASSENIPCPVEVEEVVVEVQGEVVVEEGEVVEEEGEVVEELMPNSLSMML